MKTELAALLILAVTGFSTVAHATCPDFSGTYRLPSPGECGTRGLPFTLPLSAENARGVPVIQDGYLIHKAGAVLEITQSGCEKIRLTARTGDAEYSNELALPSEMGAQQTANQGFRKASWTSRTWFDPAFLKIEHGYRSPLYVGGILNGPIGPVWKTWLFYKKGHSGLSLFNKLNYSSFRRPLDSTCDLQRVGN